MTSSPTARERSGPGAPENDEEPSTSLSDTQRLERREIAFSTYYGKISQLSGGPLELDGKTVLCARPTLEHCIQALGMPYDCGEQCCQNWAETDGRSDGVKNLFTE